MIPVQELLFQTIQGEGFYTGSVCDFIRLYGCPVGCYFCDTGYAEGTKPPSFTTINFDELNLESNHIVISGGEPMIHKNLPALCRFLLKKRKFVSIETSGAFWQPVPDDVWITLSPKEHLNKKMKVAPQLWRRADELKFVYSRNDNSISYYQDKYGHRLRKKLLKYIQPDWGYNNISRKENVMATIEILKEFPEFKLSLQTHKLIGIP